MTVNFAKLPELMRRDGADKARGDAHSYGQVRSFDDQV
jgi:hypothetical protein